MIIVKLWGGLGNQMFQYAYGYHLAKKLSEKLVLDLSWFDKQKLREPEILDMRIEYEYVEKTCSLNKAIASANKKLFNIILRIPEFKVYQIGGMNYLKEARYHYLKEIDEYAKVNSYLDGYWQCPKYFEDVKSDLQQLFVPKSISDYTTYLQTIIREKESIAVHVRRGDYRKKKRIYSRLQYLDDSYYENTIKAMINNKPDGKIYLFSNDPIKAKEIVSKYTKDIEIVNKDRKLTNLEEWYLMKSCKNQIIGNSTFSWWAAYLNDNPDKTIYVPNKYMGNDDIIPDEWVQFQVE